MRVKITVPIYGPMFSVLADYDDNTGNCTFKEPWSGRVKTEPVSVQPIIHTAHINGRRYEIATNPITNREICAWTMQRDMHGNYDPRDFLSQKDYQDFLLGK